MFSSAVFLASESKIKCLRIKIGSMGNFLGHKKIPASTPGFLFFNLMSCSAHLIGFVLANIIKD